MSGLLRTYVAALRDEPKMRAYLVGAIVDDIGIAASAWGMTLLRTDLFTDQRQRATLMLPMLVCFLLGTIVAGPLADWARHGSPQRLDRGLTETSTTLVSLAQNSASSAAIRGRIAAAFAFVAIIADILAEGAATALSESVGLPGMLSRIGLAQVALMLVVAILGGRKLWSFGIRSNEGAAPALST